MEQLEKVCKGLEFCIRNPRGVCAKECPYKMLCFYTEGETIKNRLMSDALSLLKAQEPVKPLVAGRGKSFETAETWWYECGNCGCVLTLDDKYCRKCGRAVKWE